MDEKTQEEMVFFLSNKNRLTYNKRCETCSHDCKQSFKAVLVTCPRYVKKEKSDE